MEFIKLNEHEANAIQGDSSPGYRLEPKPIKEGGYILPLSVLSDPAHSMHHEFLKSKARIPEQEIVKYDPDSEADLDEMHAKSVVIGGKPITNRVRALRELEAKAK
jgi:hypothetical protein